MHPIVLLNPMNRISYSDDAWNIMEIQLLLFHKKTRRMLNRLRMRDTSLPLVCDRHVLIFILLRKYTFETVLWFFSLLIVENTHSERKSLFNHAMTLIASVRQQVIVSWSRAWIAQRCSESSARSPFYRGRFLVNRSLDMMYFTRRISSQSLDHRMNRKDWSSVSLACSRWDRTITSHSHSHGSKYYRHPVLVVFFSSFLVLILYMIYSFTLHRYIYACPRATVIYT